MLKNGDSVVMHTCGEADHYKGKIWTCRGDEFKATNSEGVVFLEGFSGYFLAEYLQKVQVVSLQEELKELKNEMEILKEDKSFFVKAYTEKIMS